MRVDGRVAHEKRPNMPAKQKRTMWKCSLCGEEKDYKGFHGNQRAPGVKGRTCNDCAKKRREALHFSPYLCAFRHNLTTMLRMILEARQGVDGFEAATQVAQDASGT